MKPVKKIVKTFTAAALLAGLTINFNACTDQSPLALSDNNNNSQTALKTKNLSPASGIESQDWQMENYEQTENYPQSASGVVEYSRRGYRGFSLSLRNGSTFYFGHGAITPPDSIPYGSPVTVTMECDRDPNNGNLIFTFGPHGSQFSPAAAIKLSWKNLDLAVPTLYYIENGNYIEQQPEDIDIHGQWMTIKVHHFSRYALAWSR